MMLPRLLLPPESEADTPEQLRHLRRLQILHLDHVKTVLRPDVRGPHPLGDLVGVRGRPCEEQVECPRDHGLRPARVDQREVVVVRRGRARPSSISWARLPKSCERR